MKTFANIVKVQDGTTTLDFDGNIFIVPFIVNYQQACDEVFLDELLGMALQEIYGYSMVQKRGCYSDLSRAEPYLD